MVHSLVRLEKRTIEFKNYCRQINCPFKIHCDFECNLERLKFMKVLTQKNTIITFLVVLLTKLFVLMIDLVSRLLLLRVNMLLMNLLNQYLNSVNTVKKVMKKHFKKNLIITEEKEDQYQSNNTCWICKKLIDYENES